MCQPMSDDLRMTLTLPPHTTEWLDDYWHRHRLYNRQTAIRELLEYALTHERDVDAWSRNRAKLYRAGTQ